MYSATIYGSTIYGADSNPVKVVLLTGVAATSAITTPTLSVSINNPNLPSIAATSSLGSFSVFVGIPVYLSGATATFSQSTRIGSSIYPSNVLAMSAAGIVTPFLGMAINLPTVNVISAINPFLIPSLSATNMFLFLNN